MDMSQSRQETEDQAIRLLRTMPIEDCGTMVPWFTFPDWISLASRIEAGQFEVENAKEINSKLQRILVHAGYCDDSYFEQSLENAKVQLAGESEIGSADEVNFETVNASEFFENSATPSLQEVEEVNISEAQRIADTAAVEPVVEASEELTASKPAEQKPIFHTEPGSYFLDCILSSKSPTTENMEALKRSLLARRDG